MKEFIEFDLLNLKNKHNWQNTQRKIYVCIRVCSAYINTNLGPFPKNLLLPTHRKIRYNLYDFHLYTQTHTHTLIIKLENSRIGMQQNSPVSV